MKRLCVFCGSSPGSRPAYLEATERLGRALVDRGLELVYGGASVGLMGCLAKTVMAGGGHVIGVIPSALVDREIALAGLDDLRVVPSMHERKAVMADLADGFLALPGGLGTLEELFEMLTWSQLGIHAKPCGLLNVAGYYDDLDAFLDKAVGEKFIRSEHRSMILAHEDPDEILDLMESYERPMIDKVEWILSVNGRQLPRFSADGEDDEADH
jgi:uncharacterized protein (TIGR00730 family)